MMRKLSDQSGTALIATLLAVSLLTVTVVDFLYATWVERSLAASFRDDTRALEAVRSGVDAARAILIEDKRINEGGNIDHLAEYWATPSIPIPIADTYIFVTITDESGKIDLNKLAGNRMAEKLEPVFRRLLLILELDETIADAIIDWVDEDDEGYAEDWYYQSLTPSYPCKNGKLDSLEEIKRIRGITPEVFSILEKYVTISSFNGRVNINTASAKVIEALHEEISYSMVESFLQARESAPFVNTTGIQAISGFNSTIYTQMSSIIGINSDTFSVYAIANFNEVTRSARAIFTKRTNATATLIYFGIS